MITLVELRRFLMPLELGGKLYVTSEDSITVYIDGTLTEVTEVGRYYMLKNTLTPGTHYLKAENTAGVFSEAEVTVVLADEFKSYPFTYEIIPNEEEWLVRIKACEQGIEGKVEIPKTVTYCGLEFAVAEIGNGAFQSCRKMEELYIPKTVTEIGERAFQNCEELEKVNLPQELKKIQPYTFYYCKKLTEIIIPEKVTEIGESSVFLYLVRVCGYGLYLHR